MHARLDTLPSPPDTVPGVAHEAGGATVDVGVLRAALAMQRELVAVGTDLRAVMQAIADRTRELTGGDAAAVRLLDGDALVSGATSGAAELGRPQRLPLGQNFAGHAMRAGHSLLCVDAQTDERVDTALSARRGVRSIIAVPLLHGSRPVGLLLLYGRRPGAFGERDMTTMEVMSVVFSAAMAHAAEFEAKREQVEALARFEATFANALTGMVLLDLDGRIVDSNRAMHELLGHDHVALRGRSVADLLHSDDRAATEEAFRAMVAGDGKALRVDVRLVARDGEVRWVDASVSMVRDSAGRQTFAIGMVQDVTERKQIEADLVTQAELNMYQALHDALTDLPNRTLFRDRVEQATRTARRAGTRVAVLMMDLDRFKEINDSLGHAAGDALLVELGRRLKAALRGSDSVARLGGDEFGVLLPGPVGAEDVLAAVERLRTAVEEPVVVERLPLSVEASIGIALYPEHGEDAETLLQAADVAMYTAKEENSSFAFYDEASGRRDTGRLTLVGELRRALENRELALYYQPKARLADGDICSVEGLLRWIHPERGLIPPDEFIPLAQQTGLIKPLTVYVIDEALRQSRAWAEAGLTLAVAVNLSTRNLLDADFPDQVRRLLDRWGVDPHMLELEITESTMLADPVRTKAVLEGLSAMGIRLSIDDFGTGYSSLSYLRRLPVNEIKIDRSFVMNMDRNHDDATIVRSTIDLARNLGLDVVAEGVENAQTWSRLKELGCTVAQGYYLSRPVPAAELQAWVDEHGPAFAGDFGAQGAR